MPRASLRKAYAARLNADVDFDGVIFDLFKLPHFLAGAF